jgi:hypothetical protein
MKPITGTFLDEITYDIPSQNWGVDEWRLEFDTMKDAGIDTVIIIRAGLRDMCVYPSEVLGIKDVPDLATMFLDEAERCGMALYFGCYDSGRLGFEWKTWRDDWEINRRFIPEMQQRYGGHPAFKGWYIAPETVMGSEGAQEVYCRYSNLMRDINPDRPILISPGWPSYVYRDDTPAMRHQKFIDDWHAIFSKAPNVDIVAYQDGSCCYGNDFDQTFELEEYLRETQALCREFNMTLWHNIESFTWKMPIKFPTMDWRYLKRRMEIGSRYADKLITFEFSHFMSPNSMYEASRNLYKRYREEILAENPRLMSLQPRKPGEK